MTAAEIKSLFKFTSTQRTGVLMVFVLIITFQILYYTIDLTQLEPSSKEKLEWLALQSEIDTLKQHESHDASKVYPFNPNFITDFKGYKLGMSTAEIDRLLAYRKLNKWVNSAREFQQVTKISDSLLALISPYFKFPDWVNRKTANNYKQYSKTGPPKKEIITIMDINLATQQDLIKIYGIGPALSERILKEKDKYGGFVSMEQMGFIWGLSPEVIENLNKHFKVFVVPNIKKININTASVKELAQFPFFRYQLAKEIVTYRSMNGEIHTAEDLSKIKDFPVEKANVIIKYLEF